jgi:putative holliday junction resolvase
VQFLSEVNMRVMGIDYGTKTIGLAVSDELHLTVRPLTTVRRGKKTYAQVVAEICALIAEHEVGTLAVGLPLNMDGTRSEMTARVESFVNDLRAQLTIPIVLVDERLTSYEAEQILRAMGVGERERRARSDEYAAVLILQDYLDAQARQSPPR